MRNEPNKPTHITRGNVFDDLGFSPEEAARLKFKSELYSAIMKHAQKYSQNELLTLSIYNDMVNPMAKVLLLDIETLPNISYTWGKYDQNVIKFAKESCIATFAAKWIDKPQMFSAALPSYKGYRAGSYNDKALCKDLWKLFDAADIVIAHNGKQFDTKVCQSRFILHGFPPPSPFKQIDTKDAVKSVARFNSNSLNDLGSTLGFGNKIHTDFSLWQGCIMGDKASWKKMVEYNKQDVLLLEKLYIRLQPWIANHPSLAAYCGTDCCPKCGCVKLWRRGYSFTSTGKYQRLQCADCGGWVQGVKRVGKVSVKNAA